MQYTIKPSFTLLSPNGRCNNMPRLKTIPYSGRRRDLALAPIPDGRCENLAGSSGGLYGGERTYLKCVKKHQGYGNRRYMNLDTAEKLLRIETYYASVFFSEQAAEKALKALYPEKRRRM